MDVELEQLMYAVMAPGGDAVLPVPAHQAGQLKARLKSLGWAAVTVDRAPVFSKETLLHALYQALELPAWFGFNWDALADALATWSVRPSAGGALFFRDLPLLEARAPEAAATLLELVRETRDQRQVPLRLCRVVPPALPRPVTS